MSNILRGSNDSSKILAEPKPKPSNQAVLVKIPDTHVSRMEFIDEVERNKEKIIFITTIEKKVSEQQLENFRPKVPEMLSSAIKWKQCRQFFFLLPLN